MISCTSANVAFRLVRMAGMDTFTMKKSNAAKNAPVRTTASEAQRPGSGVSATAGGVFFRLAAEEASISLFRARGADSARGIGVWLFYIARVVDCRPRSPDVRTIRKT